MHATLWNEFLNSVNWNVLDQKTQTFVHKIDTQSAGIGDILSASVGIFTDCARMHNSLKAYKKMSTSGGLLDMLETMDYEFANEKRRVAEAEKNAQNFVVFWAGASHAIAQQVCSNLNEVASSSNQFKDLHDSVQDVLQKASVLFEQHWGEILAQSESEQLRVMLQKVRAVQGVGQVAETKSNSSGQTGQVPSLPPERDPVSNSVSEAPPKKRLSL